MDGEVIDAVLAAATRVFGRPVAPTDNVYALGGDSLTAVELIYHLEEAIGREVVLDLVLSADSFATLARALADQGARSQS